MLSPPNRRTRIAGLCLASIFLLLGAFASLTVHQHAATKSDGAWNFAPAEPGDGVITPAAVNTVNSTADVANGTDGLCTLREAITAANTNTASGQAAGECAAGSGIGSDTISISVAGTINLTSALPDITSNMTINGPGANTLTVQRSTAGGTPAFRIFSIQSTVNISGLTMSNGLAGTGGGILNSGTLTLTNSTVSGNTGSVGGGIFNQSVLLINGSNISSNQSAGNGGGIFNQNTITLTNSSVSGNLTASGGNGGGIYNLSFSTLNLINSTVSGNQTGDGSGPGSNGGFGGGIYNVGTVTANNSTISGNQTGGPNDRPGGGGGISNPGTLTLTNVTISGNRTGKGPGAINGYGSGGGIGSGGTVRIKNTIVANNVVAGGAAGPDLSGTFNSQDYNLIGSTSGASFTGTTTHNITNVNALLGPLADNGGATLTHALLSGSPALDAGDNCVTQATHCSDSNIPQLATEQRGAGFNRLVDGSDADTTATVDIGAFEQQVFLADLANTSTNEDTQLIVPFDAGDTSSITSVIATSDNPTLVPNDSAHLSAAVVGSTGVVTINPAANLFGTSNVTVTVNRTSGSANKTFMLTVNSANDAPSFTKGPDQIINEDADAQTISNWATNMSAGPSDESGQTLTFQVTGNTNAGLFVVSPAISLTGTLSYTPAANANGSATITVALMDNGGTANGGADTSAQTFTITVNAVNDVPSFTKGPDQVVNNNAGLRTVNNWATNASAGPSNESGQTLSFLVTSNSNPSLFTVPPAISASGTLTYRPAENAGGAAIITVVLQDNGGTANGGQNTSSSQTFNVNVNPVGGFLKFDSANFATTESSSFATITVKRTGDTSLAVTVSYATSGDNGMPCSTSSGVASSKCDFTAALGTLRFATTEDTKTFSILISQDSYVEGPETLTLTLSNQTGGAALSTPSTATVTIDDDATEPLTNSIDDTTNFVRQHYHDFLNREPDSSGLAFWVNQITSCGNDAQCIEIRRINVSAAFYLSIEFQGTGYLVERTYKAAYGDASGTSSVGPTHQLPVPIVALNEFLPDTQAIGQGVVVGQAGWETVLENNKQTFMAAFVQRSRFTTAFPSSMSAFQFVNTLNTNAGNPLSASERGQLVNDLSTNAKTRAQVLRAVAEDQDLSNAELNRAFVLMQYFGYMRRNPNDPQDTDYTGYDFWLTKLNQFNGNFIEAEMVKAFISSIEYRQRFGP